MSSCTPSDTSSNVADSTPDSKTTKPIAIDSVYPVNQSFLYTDVKAIDLSETDKEFLAKLNASRIGIGAYLSTNAGSIGYKYVFGARQLLSIEPVCATPFIVQTRIWGNGNIRYSDTTHTGGHWIIKDDTATTVDIATGKDVTCDLVAPLIAPMGVRSHSRERKIEGNLYTATTEATSITKYDSVSVESTVFRKGKVLFAEGLTMIVDTAYAHRVERTSDTALSIPSDLYASIHFEGHPYSATLHYNTSVNSIDVDIVRNQLRIGIMRLRDDLSLLVLDLGGKVIKP
jgi:hypothetical protein